MLPISELKPLNASPSVRIHLIKTVTLNESPLDEIPYWTKHPAFLFS